MRIVLDTNALVSAVLSPNGSPRRLLEGARMQVFELCSSPVLLTELLDVISREKFAKRFALAGLTPQSFMMDVRRMAFMAIPASVPRVIANDADDDHVLACALAGNADLIVSGDKHLLRVGTEYKGIRIVKPAAAVRTIENSSMARPESSDARLPRHDSAK